MKKLFMFLAVAGLATFGASCSSDDGGGGDPKTLTLSADKTSVKVNEAVTFTVSETGAELYVGDAKISNPAKFDKEGSYSVVAKKKGFNNSAAVKITVTKDGVPAKTLKLTAPAEVAVGEDVAFVVKDQDGAAVTGVQFKIAGNVVSNPWKPTAVGTYEVTASKEGYTDGKATVKVIAANVTGLTLALITNPADIFEGVGFQMSIKDADGANVTGAQLLVFGEPITGLISADGIFALSGPEGEAKFTASLGGVVSNELTVVIQPANTPEPEGTGTLVFGGNSYNLTSSYVVFMGLTYADETQTTVVANWQIEASTADNGHAGIIGFTTPATPAAEEGFYNYELPSATNVTTKGATAFVGETAFGNSTTGVTLAFNAVREGDFFNGNYSGASAPILGNPFSMSFDGASVYFDASAKPAARTAGKKVSFRNATNKASNVSAKTFKVQSMKKIVK